MSSTEIYILTESGHFREALDVFERSSRDGPCIANACLAAFHLGEWERALDLLNQGEKDESYYKSAGLAYWGLGDYRAAAGLWLPTLAFASRDDSAGLRLPSLAWFASYATGDLSARKQALSTLRSRTRRRECYPWPQAFGYLLLGKLSPVQYLKSLQTGHPALRPRAETVVHFWLGAWSKGAGDNVSCIEHYRTAAAAKGNAILEIEYYLAVLELSRMDAKSSPPASFFSRIKSLFGKPSPW